MYTKRLVKANYDGELECGDIIFDEYGNAYNVVDKDDEFYYAN